MIGAMDLARSRKMRAGNPSGPVGEDKSRQRNNLKTTRARMELGTPSLISGSEKTKSTDFGGETHFATEALASKFALS